jgi:hypothetical protein
MNKRKEGREIKPVSELPEGREKRAERKEDGNNLQQQEG